MSKKEELFNGMVDELGVDPMAAHLGELALVARKGVGERRNADDELVWKGAGHADKARCRTQREIAVDDEDDGHVECGVHFGREDAAQ